LHHEALLHRANLIRAKLPLRKTRERRKGKSGFREPVEHLCAVPPESELGRRICKPNSVRGIAPAGRPFLWAAHRCAALATYPEV
jgi:hypothetical protein